MGVCTIVPRDQKGFQPRVFGMGILVRDREIVTCFHVITTALGEGWQEQPGDAVVGICFPMEVKTPWVEGKVDKKRSFAPGRTSGEEPSDVAVIQLAQDVPGSFERAFLLEHVLGSTALAFGFRSKEIGGDLQAHPTGQRAGGKIMGSLAGGRGQFDGVNQIGVRVEHGFSGAGVYDLGRDAVVGMIVETDRKYEYIAQFIDVPSLQKVIGEQSKEQNKSLLWPPDPIVNLLKVGTLVPVLGPSVNPKIYIDLAARLVQLLSTKPPPADSSSDQGQKEEDEQRLQEQEKRRREEAKTFVWNHFGSRCTICHYVPSLRPDECPLIAGLQGDESLIDEQTLSVAKANCRSLCRLFEIRTRPESLYSNISDIFTKYSKEENRFYKSLANLVRDWPSLSHASGWSEPTDTVGEWQKSCPPFSLIVTTSSDCGLERAFQGAKGLKVDLIWYVAGGTYRGKFKYKPHNKDKGMIVTKDSPLEAESDVVVILKLFGTMDDYFLITQDQMDYFLSSAADRVPNTLLAKVQQANVLFLGFSPNDADLRAIVQRLYPDERKIDNNSWLIHRGNVGTLDKEIWKSRGSVELLQVDNPLDKLITDMREAVGNSNN